MGICRAVLKEKLLDFVFLRDLTLVQNNPRYWRFALYLMRGGNNTAAAKMSIPKKWKRYFSRIRALLT